MKTSARIFTKQFFFQSLCIALCYFLLYLVLVNWRLVSQTFFDGRSVLYHVALFEALIRGFPQTVPLASSLIFLSNALLTGATITLLIQRMRLLKQFGKVHVVAGGSSILSIVSTGCASCGLPLLSLLGLGGVVLYLPFHGAELPYISFLLLLISFGILIKTTRKAIACKI